MPGCVRETSYATGLHGNLGRVADAAGQTVRALRPALCTVGPDGAIRADMDACRGPQRLKATERLFGDGF